MPIKTKIYLTFVIWLGVCGAMFMYGFGILDGQNQLTAAKVATEKTAMQQLQQQQQSYIQAQQDLKKLSQEKMQPDDFFSEDVTLVKEIETLEGVASKAGVQVSLGGISGTVNSAPKASTKSSLFLEPYSMSITGDFFKVVDFIQAMEQLSFVTTVSQITVSSLTGGEVTMSLSANFYIRKQTP